MRASLAARWLPRDFVESSQVGGACTIVAYVVMALICLREFGAAMTSSYSTQMMLDRHDGDMLQINFDVDLYDIECRNLRVVVYAQQSQEKISSWAQDFWLRPVDASGRAFGMATKPADFSDAELRGEEGHQKTMEKLVREDGREELDADWDSSHDGFKHKSFEHVIQAHDFTFIDFFASWCGHCQTFAPTWDAMAVKLNGDGNSPGRTFEDRDQVPRNVRMIKMNCMDFQDVCMQRGIDAFPTLRLYKADGTFAVYEGLRDEGEIIRWVERTVKMKRYGWADHHDAFERGCNARGHVKVPRVPGHLELMAGAGDQNLNIKMTNVSHMVKHLSFSDPSDGKNFRRSWRDMPQDVLSHTNPLDGMAFITHSFHQTWLHDLQVVSTVSPWGSIAYQFKPSRRLAQVSEDVLPQAQFHFDIEPFSIQIRPDEKRWYDFVTSLLAVLGGYFVVMRLLAGGAKAALATLKLSRKGSHGALYVSGRYE